MRINNVQIFILCMVSFFATSCYSYRSTGLLQEYNKNTSTYNPQEYKDYRIRINDEIIYRLITVTQEIPTSMLGSVASGGIQNVITYRVYADGTIDLPFLASVPVEGLTVDEAERIIEKKMKDIVPDATVKLALANKSFTIIGDIGTGIFPVYKEKLTIFQALSMSGDLLQAGDRQHVRILRETDDGTKVLEFDIRPASIIESENYYIYPNDIVYIQRSPSSFYKVSSYSSFLGLITTSITLFFTVLYYTK